LFILFINIAFLFPLALYCLILALVNRRRRPVMVSGPWDFAGVLLGLSGFILAGGPAILDGFHRRWLTLWLTSADYRGTRLDEKHLYWVSLWAAYFVLVVGVCALVFWLRRWQTSIYNIQPAAADTALGQALDRLGLSWERYGNRLVVHPPTPWSAPPVKGLEVAREETLGIQVEPFPALRHVSLRWSTDGGLLRDRIEQELAEVLRHVNTCDNPAAVWFTSFGAGLLSLMLFDIALLAYRIYQEIK
jgi:hypothetical protein